VALALPVLQHSKLSVRWTEDIEVATGHSGISSRSRRVTRPAGRDYIWGAELTARERLTVQVEPKPWPATAGVGADFDDGCQGPTTG
jgi:hypothetical protein